MSNYRLGRAFFETGMDLSGLDRGLHKAEQRVRQYQVRIERQATRGKAFSFVAPFQRQTIAISKASKQATASLGMMGRAASMLQSPIGKLAAGMLGTSLTIYGLQAAIRSTVNSAAEFQTAMANIGTLSANSAEQMKLLRHGLISLGGQVGEAPIKLAGALYDVVSAGYSGAEALKVLEASAKAARAGLTTTKVSADAVTTALNAYGMAADQATHVTDVLQTTVKYGKTTWGELAPSIGQVIPLAAAAGVSLEELGGALAVLTGNGVQTSLAVTQVRSLIAALLKQTDKAKGVMEKYNFTIDQSTLRQKGLIGTLQEMQKHIGGNTEALFGFLGRVEAVNAALALTTDQGFKKLVDVTEEMKTATDVVKGAFGEQMETAKAQIDRFNASLEALRIEMGDNLLPVIGNVAGGLANLINTMMGLPDMARYNRFAEEFVKSLGGSVTEANTEDIANITLELEKLKKVQAEIAQMSTGQLKFPVLEAKLEQMGVDAKTIKKLIADYDKAVSNGPEAARKFLATLKPRLLNEINDQMLTLQKRMEQIAKGTDPSGALNEFKAIQKELANARQMAQQNQNAGIFKEAAKSAVGKLEQMKQQFTDNKEIAAQIDDLIKQINVEAKGFKIIPTGAQGGAAAVEDFLKPYREKLQGLTLKVKLGLIDKGQAEQELTHLKAQLNNLLKRTSSTAKQNSIMTLLLSVNMTLDGMKRKVKQVDDGFSTWLKKLETQAHLGIRPVKDILTEVEGARTKILKQVADLGPIDSPEKLKILFDLDAKLQGLDQLRNTLKTQLGHAIDQKTVDAFTQASNELMSALENGLDVEKARAAAEQLRQMLADENNKIPDDLRDATQKILAQYDTLMQGISDAQTRIAEELNSKRYGDGYAKFASDLRMSFDTVGEALLYMIKTGNTGEASMHALAQAFGEDGQAVLDASNGYTRLNRALQLGLITKAEYIRRIKTTISVLQVLVQKVDQNSEAFDLLSKMLLDSETALKQIEGGAKDAAAAIEKLEISARKVAAIFKAGGSSVGELFAGFTSDAQLSKDEAVALAETYGLVGDALAQVGGGLNTLRGKLEMGMISQEEYMQALEKTAQILENLAEANKDNATLFSFYTSMLRSVRGEISGLAEDAAKLGSALLPEELQRRADMLASQFKDLASALANLARDGKLTEQEMQILKAAFGDQADTIAQAFDGFKLWQTQLDLGQMSQEEFRQKVLDLVPVLEAALAQVKEGSAAWYLLAGAIKEAKDAAGEPTQTKVPLPTEIGDALDTINKQGQAGLFGSGLVAQQRMLEETANAIRQKVSKAIADGMDPDNPDIVAAIEKLQSVEIELHLVQAGVQIGNAFTNAGMKVGSALVDYLVKGGQDAGATLHNAIMDAGHSLSQELRKVMAKTGADLGGKIGGDIGAALGGAAGSFAGPAGTAIGSAVGYIVGDLIGALLGNLIDWITGANQPQEPASVADQRVTSSVSEVNYNAIANVYYQSGMTMEDPEVRAQLRSFVRQTATDLLQQLGLVKGQVANA